MKKEIFLRSVGNTGNQLFQFSFANYIKTKYQFDEINIIFSNFGDQIQGANLEYNMIKDPMVFYKKMNFIQRLFFNIGSSGRPFFKRRWLSFGNDKNGKIIKKRLNFYSKLGIIYCFEMQAKNIKLPKYIKRCFIMGFYESKVYLDYNKNYIHKNYVGKDISSISHFVDKYKDEQSVCVTVRRGDFLSDKYKETFYVCDLDYFKKAMSLLKNKLANPVFVIFSDDINWAKENFGQDNIYEIDNLSKWQKLYAMSKCKHFILSNSTFSYWAWYLSNDSENKIVISPLSWKATYLDNHLIEKDWTLIKTNLIRI